MVQSKLDFLPMLVVADEEVFVQAAASSRVGVRISPYTAFQRCLQTTDRLFLPLNCRCLGVVLSLQCPHPSNPTLLALPVCSLLPCRLRLAERLPTRGEAGHCPECCPRDRRGDRTTSGHVLITIERILTGQVGQG